MGDIDGWQVNGKRGYFQHHAYSTGRSRYTCVVKNGEIRARGGSWADRHCSTTWLTSWVSDYFGFNTKSSHITLSPQLEIVFIVVDRSFLFIPVYLYSSAYRPIINTPARRYAGCSRGCPAAFKQGFHLALVLESQHQGEYVDVDWMCSLTVFPEKCTTMVHM